MEHTQLRIVDGRTPGWFWLDNAIVDEYWPKIGLPAQSVMTVLARMANQERSCFPSLASLAQRSGLDRRTVMRALHTLEEHRLISVHHTRTPEGDAGANIYTLLSPEGVGAESPHLGAQDHHGRGSMPLGVGAESPPNKIYIEQEPMNKTKPPLYIVPPKKGSGKKTPGSHRCPANYEPSSHVRAWAGEKFSWLDFEECLEAMRDWEFKTARSDWDACLRQWIRTQAERSPRAPQKPRKTAQEIMAALEAEDEAKRLAAEGKQHP